jgi:hypothetical protein
MKVHRIGMLVFAALATTAIARQARAEGAPHEGAFDRPYTVAQLGVGLLTLPAADVCLSSLNGRTCTKGDNSIELDFWQLYRANRFFAIGAGASVALVPVTDNPPSPDPTIDRTHTRSYFLVEAQGRYYFVRAETFEAWLGITAGGVIVSDRYSIDLVQKSTAAIIGPNASTVRTEGGALGALLGSSWHFAPNWAFGFSVRYMQWFLPHDPATTVFLDRATLTGEQRAFNFGISVSYRIAL